jgi:hypothetical protein
VLRFFDFGTPPFQRLVGEFRRRIFEEVAASDLPGMIFTYVWAFDQASDAAAVDEFARPFASAAAACCSWSWRRRRPSGCAATRPSSGSPRRRRKRDVAASRERLLHNDVSYQLQLARRVATIVPTGCASTTRRSPADAVAELVVERFALPRVPAAT